jgi:hypothetical protein
VQHSVKQPVNPCIVPFPNQEKQLHLNPMSPAAALLHIPTQQQQLVPEPVQQQQPKFFRRQRRAAASTHIQLPGLPVTLPRSLIPASLAAPESLWGRLLLAGIGVAAAASALMQLSSSSSSSQDTRQEAAAGGEAFAQELAAPLRPTALDDLLSAIQDSHQTAEAAAAAAGADTGDLQAQQQQQEGVQVVNVPASLLAAAVIELQQQQEQQQEELNAQVCTHMQR